MTDWTGSWRSPRNLLTAQDTGAIATIHDDGTAAALGFARGTIEGPTHFSQLTPGLVEMWGPAFFERGRISVHYTSPAYDGDRLQAALVSDPETTSAGVSVTRDDGTLILIGTADLDHALTESEVDRRLHAARPGPTRSVLDQVEIGDRSPAERFQITFDEIPGPAYPFTLAEKLAVITEPSPWYGPSVEPGAPWDRPVLPFEVISVLLQCTSDQAFRVRPEAVGLFLDQEISILNGPLFAAQPYVLDREVVAFSASSRTESYWVRTNVTDEATGHLLAVGTIHVGFLVTREQ
jgi:hypothetical protein